MTTPDAASTTATPNPTPDSPLMSLYRHALGPVGIERNIRVFSQFEATGRTRPGWNGAAAFLTLHWMVFHRLWRPAGLYAFLAALLLGLFWWVDAATMPTLASVRWWLLLAFGVVGTLLPGLYGDALLYAQTELRVHNAIAEAQTLAQARTLLARRAGSNRRMGWQALAHVLLLALGGVLALVGMAPPQQPLLSSQAPEPTMASPLPPTPTPTPTPAPTPILPIQGATPTVAALPPTQPTPSAQPTPPVSAPTPQPPPEEAQRLPAKVAIKPPPEPLPKPQAKVYSSRDASHPTPAAPTPPHPVPVFVPAPEPAPARPNAPSKTPVKTPAKTPGKVAVQTARPATPAASAADEKKKEKDKEKDTATGRFFIHAGTFALASNAEKVHARIEHAGLPATLQHFTNADKDLIRVRVGPFASRAEADRAAAKLRAMGLDAMIYGR